MPKGHHYSRSKTRSYTTDYKRIKANTFKQLLNSPLGSYTIQNDYLSTEHKKLELTQHQRHRVMTFLINGNYHQIALIIDSHSASNKLYISCPYCQSKRESLYVTKKAYACRTCLNLNYVTQSERQATRLVRRIRQLRRQLWGNDWLEVDNMLTSSNDWPKPKHARWKTFNQQKSTINKLEDTYYPILMSQLGNICGSSINGEYL